MKKIPYIIGTSLLSLAFGIGGYALGAKETAEENPFKYIKADSVKQMQEDFGGVYFVQDKEGNFRSISIPSIELLIRSEKLQK